MCGTLWCFSSWRGKWDVKLCKIITSKFQNKTNTIQFSIDVLNIGNLLNSDWFRTRQVCSLLELLIKHKVPTYTLVHTQTKTFNYEFVVKMASTVGLRYILKQLRSLRRNFLKKRLFCFQIQICVPF
jgi:hypothetical protein